MGPTQYKARCRSSARTPSQGTVPFCSLVLFAFCLARSLSLSFLAELFFFFPLSLYQCLACFFVQFSKFIRVTMSAYDTEHANAPVSKIVKTFLCRRPRADLISSSAPVRPLSSSIRVCVCLLDCLCAAYTIDHYCC